MLDRLSLRRLGGLIARSGFPQATTVRAYVVLAVLG